MAIRHVVLFSFKPTADPNVIRQLIDELNALPTVIAEIKDWAIKEDAGQRDYSAQFALIATFDSMEAVAKYLAHPAHVRVVDKALPLVDHLLEHDHEA